MTKKKPSQQQSSLIYDPKLLLLGLVCLALVLRLPLLSGSFWLDEAAQALESARPFSQQLDIVADFQPPLLHYLLHFALYFGQSEWWLRLIGALLPGLSMVVFLYLINLELKRSKLKPSVLQKKISSSEFVSSGLFRASVATVLLATSSFHVFYSQELRPYALPAAWGCIGWWLLIKLSHKHSARSWLLYGVTTLLGLFSSYLYPFLVMGHAGWWLLNQPKNWKPLVLTLLTAGVFFAPLLPLFKSQLDAGGQVRLDLPGWEDVVSTPQLKALPLVVGKFVFGVVNIEPNLVFLGSGAVLSAILAFLGWSYLSQQKVTPSFLLSILKHPFWWWVIAPLLVAWIVSFWIPVVRPKRFLFALPGFYLGLAMIIEWAVVSRSKTTQLLGKALLAILFVINVVSLSAYYSSPSLQRENWRDLHQELRSKYPENGIMVFAYIAPYSPIRWYEQSLPVAEQYPTLSTGTLNINQVPSVREWLEPVTEYRFVIVFEYLSDLSDPERVLLEEIESYGYVTVDIIEYPSIGFVRVYTRPNSTLSSR